MALDLPTTEYQRIFYTSDEPEKAGLGSLLYWKHYAGVRAAGYGDAVDYFEPVLKESQEMLEILAPYEDPRWIRAVRMQLDKEIALLHQLRTHRDSYGVMAVRLKAYEHQRSNEFEEWEKMRAELQKIDEEVNDIIQKQREEEMKLEGKISQIDDLIRQKSSFVDIDTKIKQARKFASKYNDEFEFLNLETTTLKQKSREAAKRFEQIERGNVEMILKTWKDAIAEIDRAYYNYKSIVKLNRDGVAVVERINSHSIINKRMSNYHKTMGFNKFQKSEEVIKRSNSCRRYFRKTEARHLREKEYEESIKSLESDTSLLAVEEKDERIVSNVIIPQKEEKEELKEPKDEKEVSAPKEEKEEVRAPKEEKETVVQDHGIEPPLAKIEVTKERELPQIPSQIIKEEPTTKDTKSKGKGKKFFGKKKKQTDTATKDKKESTSGKHDEAPANSDMGEYKPKKVRSYIPTKTFSIHKGKIYIAIPVRGPKLPAPPPPPPPIIPLEGTSEGAIEEKKHVKKPKKTEKAKPEKPPPIKPRTCWDGPAWDPSLTPEEIQNQLRPPYKVTIAYSYEEQRKCELSVKAGDRVKIVSYPDPIGQVKAKKKFGYIFAKSGWIPLETFY